MVQDKIKNKKGLFKKYILTRTDGKPIEPEQGGDKDSLLDEMVGLSDNFDALIKSKQGGEDESSEVLKYLNTISPNDEIGVREKLYELGMINVVMSMMDRYANHKLSGVKGKIEGKIEELRKEDHYTLGDYPNNRQGISVLTELLKEIN
jgi:hypothetical protein